MKSGYFFISLTVAFTVIGQLLVKAGVAKVLSTSAEPLALSRLIVAALLNPAVISGLICALIAAISWFPAVSRLPISVAYPFMALSIVLVLFLAPLCFGERVGLNQWMGVVLVSFGLWLASR
jgi:drug/metabolite transporter (DMT)-like permease